MKIKQILMACVALLLATNAFTAESPDIRAIEGNWTPIKAELSGKPMPDAVLKTISLKLADGKYEVIANGHPDNGTYSVDTKSSPKQMTVIGTDGPNKGKTYPCIYELKDDKLRICYDLSGKRHPDAFKSLTGTQLYLVTYIRKK